MKKITLIRVFAYTLIFLWLYASLAKLLDYPNFKVQLGKSPLLTGFAPLLAILIPIIELLIAGLLYSNRLRFVGFYASLILLMSFTTYLIIILNYSYYIPCSCGGIIGKGLSWKTHIVFNLVFVLISIIGVYETSQKNEPTLSQPNQYAA